MAKKVTTSLLFMLNELYYGKSYKEKKELTFQLGTVNKGTFASLREEYNIPDLRCEAYYIIKVR